MPGAASRVQGNDRVQGAGIRTTTGSRMSAPEAKKTTKIVQLTFICILYKSTVVVTI